MRVTWDPTKAAANLAKHGVSFEEAASALRDPFALEASDLTDPDRNIVIGMSAKHRVLFVVIVDFETADVVRIISARRASPSQRKKMKKLPEGHIDRYDWSKATRGRLAKRLAAEGSNLRALDEDLARAFPDSASVNTALREAVALRSASTRTKKSRSRRAA